MGPTGIRDILEAYLESHDAAWFAPDGLYTIMPAMRRFAGREAIAGALDLFYRRAFSPAWIDVHQTVVDPSGLLAAVEFSFKGRPAGGASVPARGAPVPAGGDPVTVPMVGLYEFREGKIACARIYYDHTAFLGRHPDLGHGP